MRADSDDTRRELQLEMSPQATHIVAWLPLTLPLPVLEQDGQGLGPGAAALGEERREKRAPLQGSLGQGQGDKARGQSADLASSSAPVNGPSARCHALGQALSALRPSLAGTPGPCARIMDSGISRHRRSRRVGWRQPCMRWCANDAANTHRGRGPHPGRMWCCRGAGRRATARCVPSSSAGGRP